MTDLGVTAQRAAERHLEACEDARWREEDGEDVEDHPAIGPYDGCTTCIVREVLHVAVPILLGESE